MELDMVPVSLPKAAVPIVLPVPPGGVKAPECTHKPEKRAVLEDWLLRRAASHGGPPSLGRGGRGEC